MADFANPINPQFTQAPAYSAAAPSIQRQRNGTELDGAVQQTSVTNPTRKRPDEELLERTLDRLQPKPPGKDPLKEIQENQRVGHVAPKSSDSSDQAGLKDRGRLYNDENKTLNADDIALSKPNTQELNTEQNAPNNTAQKPRQAASEQVLKDTQSKHDLPAPQAYTTPEQQASVLKPAIREKFEALRPVLVDSQRKSDPKNLTEGILKARFERNEQQKQVALEAQAATNEITKERLDRAQLDAATVRALETDDRIVQQNPEIANNPRISISQNLEKNDTLALDRIDTGLDADLRRADIVGQQYEEKQRDLQRNGAGVDTIQARATGVVGEITEDNFDRYQTRLAERETGISENPSETRLDRVNPKSAAVAQDQAAAKTKSSVLEQTETQLEGIKNTNVATDYDYPPEVTPERLYEQEQKAQLQGGDALNAPDRQVRQPIDKLERTQRPEITSKTIESAPESVQIQKLADTVVKPEKTVTSVIQVRDPSAENEALASRKDAMGIKAQGRVADEIRAETHAIGDQRLDTNKVEREQRVLSNQQETAKVITAENRDARARADVESVQRREARTESVDLGRIRRSTKGQELVDTEADAVKARYDQRIDQRELSSDDAKFRQNTALVLDTVAKDKRAQVHDDIAVLQGNKTTNDEAIEYEQGLNMANEEIQEDYEINIAAPAIREVKLEVDEEAAAAFSADRIEIAAPAVSASITVAPAERPTPSETSIAANTASEVIERNSIANKDNGATANLGDSSARAELDQLAGTA